MRHLLGLKEATKFEIQEILSGAQKMKKILEGDSKKITALRGKSVITLFYENSTRTRLSFELAAKYMSADAANIATSSSSTAKGETLIDTARTIDHMGVGAIVMRHNCSGACHLIAKHVQASVINAGDGMNEHPTQALLDMFSMIEKKGRIEGLKVAIIGDILHSRVARSNIYGLTKLGAEIHLAAPLTLMPPSIEEQNVTVHTSVTQAMANADVVMGLRIQNERQKGGYYSATREYSDFFGINSSNLTVAKKDVLVLHPGPVNRGVEMSSEVIDRSYIDEQVTNGVAVRMAVLDLLLGGSL